MKAIPGWAAVVASVKAGIKRLDIKTQRGVERGTPEGRPTPAQRGQVPCDYCGGDHPVEDCEEVPGWCEWCSGHHDFSECARAQRELGQQEWLTLVKGQSGSDRSGPEVATAEEPKAAAAQDSKGITREQYIALMTEHGGMLTSSAELLWERHAAVLGEMSPEKALRVAQAYAAAKVELERLLDRGREARQKQKAERT